MSDPAFDLAGRIALVTGSSRGLGAASAARLARAGADVVVTYRKQADAAHGVAERVRAEGRRAWVHPLDMGDNESIEALFGHVADVIGGLDILVANAAATSFRPILSAEPRHLDRTFAISVGGFVRAVQLAVPLLQERGGGRIVAVSGADTRTWIPAHGILAAAKAAMETLVRYLACEIGESNITVVGVNPGWISGESIKTMLGPFYDAAIATERKTHPLRVEATPDDIAEVVALLCTDAARWLSGSTVEADGSGVFAFCGRYSQVGGELALSRLSEPPAAGEAPSVPR